MMTTKEILRQFKDLGLTRDLLYYWSKRKWCIPNRIRQGRSTRRVYPEREVEKISLMLKGYNSGFAFEKAHEIASQPDHSPMLLLANPKLVQLLNASREMAIARSVFLEDRDETLDTIIQLVHDLLEAESCSVFLIREDFPRELRLAAQAPGGKPKGPELTLRIHHRPGRGLTGYLAFEKKSVRLHGAALRQHPGTTGGPPQHLPSGQCLSLLMVPLMDRKRRVFGWLKAENRKGPGGRATEASFFDATDQAMAENLASQIVVVLEGLRLVGASRTLIEKVLATPCLPKCLEEILSQALRLVRANRADVFWRDEEHKAFIMAAQARVRSPLEVGQPLPEPSITSRVYRTRQWCLLDDVSQDREYYCGWPRTKSEVAVPLLRPGPPPGEALGVLNLESSKLAAFDRQDVGVLQHLAFYAVFAAQIVEARDAICRRLVDQMSEQWLEPEEALHAILESVERDLDLDEGIIYIADYKNATLRCMAARPRRAAARRFSYKFDETSFACKVFEDKRPRYCEDPWRDPVVAKEGLKFFDIHNPLVGVPLLFGDTVVGVLVVWSRRGRRPEETDKELLGRYARLAVTTIAISESERQRRDTFEYLREVVAQIQRTAPLDDVIRTVLKAVLYCGFGRSFIFRLAAEEQAFVCLDSFGEQPPGDFAGVRIPLKDNPYADHLVKVGTSPNPAPQVIDPNIFGYDAEPVGRPEEHKAPWAVAFLAIGGKLYGYISADRMRAGSKSATPGLEYLRLLGILAAQALSSRNPAS